MSPVILANKKYYKFFKECKATLQELCKKPNSTTLINKYFTFVYLTERNKTKIFFVA